MFLTCTCALPLAWADIFLGAAKMTFCSSVSDCWRCNANWRTQNALPFLRHKENAQCYGSTAEVSMHKITNWYPTGYLWFFGIRIGFGYLFLKKIGSGQDQDICLISIAKFSREWFKMSQMMVLFFLCCDFYIHKKSKSFCQQPMCCTHHNQW